MKTHQLLVSIILCLLLSSCGQTGPLYLPAAQTQSTPASTGH